jgi:hypothetical protein
MVMRSFVVLSALAAALPLWGQAAAAYDPQGVHVDAKGVLRSRSVDPDPRLAELWKNAKSIQKDAKTLYVSLPRLFAEARRTLEAGRPLPPELRHLGGMTRLQYVFVHPESKDLVIAGPAEPIDARDGFRPLGKITGRPLLHLDDLVTALRAFGPGRNPDRLGCDIEITAEIKERANAKIQALGPAARITGFRKTCDQIAEAAGPQPVKYYGLEPRTRFAFVCVEADYRLKQLGLGLLPSPVPNVESYRSLIDRPEREFRFSLESNYDALAASPDGLAFELRGPSLKVNGGLLGPSGEHGAGPLARREALRDALQRELRRADPPPGLVGGPLQPGRSLGARGARGRRGPGRQGGLGPGVDPRPEGVSGPGDRGSRDGGDALQLQRAGATTRSSSRAESGSSRRSGRPSAPPTTSWRPRRRDRKRGWSSSRK